MTLALDALDGDCDIPGAPGASARLRSLRVTVLDALRNHENGPFAREALLASGLISAGAKEARGLEWRRQIDVGMVPGMPAAARREAAKAGASNRAIRKFAMMWTAIAALLADDGPEVFLMGAAGGRQVRTRNGTGDRVEGRKPVTKGWKVPTLLIDANLNVRTSFVPGGPLT